MPDTTSFSAEILQKLADFFPTLVDWLKSVMGFLIGISIPLSLFFFIGIIYCVEELKKIRRKEAEMHDLKVETAFETADSGDRTMAHRWENALKHIESPNGSDWKQAIIEADIILDDLLTKMGYRGESVGEKLKRVEPGDMKSLNDAWEAHKVRNQIAHEGSGFELTQYTAKQVIHMYKKVFVEFYYI
ncbi:MAG: hypothetical protein QOG91_572 [Candidatus Parcubacteria bacterium]|jgi:hypothetical protein|nr:hypothetical protein [Candidatus Parcubacteria bacterium]